jgi:phenylpropionate dioxygenase-like ring-hydroxylating dioxygenase large terminal subunit
MIQNQWYAVLSSRQVKKGEVVSARRFGMNLVFFRTYDGAIACVKDACAHRGASLGGGCVHAGNIKCPFHGIEYDARGRCIHIPSEGLASTKDYSRFNLMSFAVRELAGIVFVWYGEGEPEGEPRPFEVLMDTSYAFDEIQDTWNVDYSRVIENQLDVSHLAFVHATTIGRGNKTLVNGPKVVWLDEDTLQTSANNEVDEGQRPKDAGDAEIRSTNLTFRFPNMWLNHVSDKILIFAYFAPIDDEHAIICLRFYNKITGFAPLDKVIAWLGSRANKVVERQDKRVVETQLPKKTGIAIGECLVAADRPIIEYRKRRHELQRQ